MKYLKQFGIILTVSFLGEVLHHFIPLPIPASIYGLLLLLAGLKLGFVKLNQVQDTAHFLTGIFPVLFIPAAVGVMDLWEEIGALLLPVLLCLFPVTILVMAVSGRVTQAVSKRKEDSDHA